jgi:hypothetical protein
VGADSALPHDHDGTAVQPFNGGAPGTSSDGAAGDGSPPAPASPAASGDEDQQLREELGLAAAGANGEQQRLGLFSLAKLGYEAVVGSIIRPPRAEYELDDLGPLQFDLRGRRFERADFEVTNARAQRLVGSWWRPVPEDRPAEALPCVVYLHGNSSCRLGALEALELLLCEGVTVVAFDFSGSGRSDGEFVTLGFHEKDDLAAVVAHLRGSGIVSTIALWGRSMGAATALLHSHRDPSIAGLVLDSSFSDLKQLALELAEMGRGGLAGGAR